MSFLPGMAGPIAQTKQFTVLETISVVSTTAVDKSTTIAWPGTRQAGDVAIFVDSRVGAPYSDQVIASGFTKFASYPDTNGTPNMNFCYRILDGSESGSISGLPDMSGYGVQKALLIVRGSIPIKSVSVHDWTVYVQNNPPAINVDSSGMTSPGMVLAAMQQGSSNPVNFSTQSPAFDTVLFSYSDPGGGTRYSLRVGYTLKNRGQSASDQTAERTGNAVCIGAGWLEFLG